MNLNDWEVENFSNLMSELERVNIRTNNDDKRMWTMDPSKYISCNSYFEFLVNNPKGQVFHHLHHCGFARF